MTFCLSRLSDLGSGRDDEAEATSLARLASTGVRTLPVRITVSFKIPDLMLEPGMSL